MKRFYFDLSNCDASEANERQIWHAKVAVIELIALYWRRDDDGLLVSGHCGSTRMLGLPCPVHSMCARAAVRCAIYRSWSFGSPRCLWPAGARLLLVSSSSQRRAPAERDTHTHTHRRRPDNVRVQTWKNCTHTRTHTHILKLRMLRPLHVRGGGQINKVLPFRSEQPLDKRIKPPEVIINNMTEKSRTHALLRRMHAAYTHTTQNNTTYLG